MLSTGHQYKAAWLTLEEKLLQKIEINFEFHNTVQQLFKLYQH